MILKGLLALSLSLSFSCSPKRVPPERHPVVFKNVFCDELDDKRTCWCGIAEDYGIDVKGNQVMWCTGEGK